MSLNKVMLIGNVGQEPEIRYLDNSQAKVARLRIATTEVFTDRNGEKRENTEWHTVTAWRRLADLAEKFIHKGTQIYVEGRLTTREWTDNTGAKRTTTEISADNVQLLGRRSDAPAQAAQSAPANTFGQGSFHGNPASSPAGPGGYQPPYQPVQTAASQAVPSAPATDFGAEGDDDLPF